MQLSLLDQQDVYNKLSTTRKAILQYTAKGLTEAAIGEKLGLAKKTIKFHKTNIYKLFQVKSSTTELVTLYYTLHLNSDDNFKSELEQVRAELYTTAAERDQLRAALAAAEARLLVLERAAGVLPLGFGGRSA